LTGQAALASSLFREFWKAGLKQCSRQLLAVGGIPTQPTSSLPFLAFSSAPARIPASPPSQPVPPFRLGHREPTSDSKAALARLVFKETFQACSRVAMFCPLESP